MSQFWSEFVHGLEPYVPGEQPAAVAGLVKLNTNENPYGPSPRALAAMRAALGDDLRLYPDPESSRLRAAIGEYYGVPLQQVFVGNGSDEVLAHVFNGLLRQREAVLFPAITYSFYPVYCGLYGIASRQIPLDDGLRVRVDDYLVPNGGIIIANPNAPTGCLLPLPDIARLLEQHPASVVVIDEAYIDFGGESAVGLVRRYPNLLVVQTLSKSRSLAGLRVGFAVGQEPLIEALNRVKNSFNSYPLDRVAQAGAEAALADRDHFEHNRRLVMQRRQELVGGLVEQGFSVLPSAANFVLATHPRRQARDIYLALRQRNVIVRHFALPAIDNYLRISVGTEAQQQALFDALRQTLS